MSQKKLLKRLDRLLDWLEGDANQNIDWSALAYRWRGSLQPIRHLRMQSLNELQNIDRQKSELLSNTANFVAGQPANNALLWGSRGTGKSSLIRAMLGKFSDQGLRLIEVDKSDLINLPDIVEPLYERKERFIIYCDDLSFEADDPSYKALKAALDGSIADTPDNVLLYATSNRRHLLPEFMDENHQARNVNGEIHHGDTVEEKISLSERFGLWLAFHPFSQDEYLAVVASEFKRYKLKPTEAARTEALRYALARGSRSGRVAAQFATQWAGSAEHQSP